MIYLRSILVLFIGLILILSFVVPAEDALETAYDESESLPFDRTPTVSIVPVAGLGKPHAVQPGASQFFGSLLGTVEVLHSDLRTAPPSPNSHSLIIADQSFRL